MECQKLVDTRRGQNALELRFPEPLGLAEILMIGHEPCDPLALGVREPKLPAKAIRNSAADLVVVVEACPPMPVRAGQRLSHVVYERREGESEARVCRQQPKDKHRMVPQVPLGLDR